MKTIRKLLLAYAVVIFLLIVLSLNAIAHSGGTDSQGGHKDNKNVSGLGPYHFHHGMGPHLHPNGVCPYSSPPTTTSKTTYSAPPTTTSKTTYSAPPTSNINRHNEKAAGNNIGMFLLGGAFSLGTLGLIRKIFKQ